MQEGPEKVKLQHSEIMAHPLVAEAYQLFLKHQYQEAVPLLQKYLQESGAPNIPIDGLGNNELTVGYYEWFIPEWYQKGIEEKSYFGTPYDILSLSLLSLKNNEDLVQSGTKWYRHMISLYPNNYQMKLGLANLLGSKSIYEEALQLYNKVSQLKPDWVRPLECIAYIYQYKRIEKSKAIEFSKKLLEMEATNRVGLFVLARNQKNYDSKIEKLKVVSELHPKYARAINEIGIVYGGSKKLYDEAISWYKKCTEVTPQYASCYNNIGVNYELKKEYPQAIRWYFLAIEKDKEYKAPHKNMSDIFDQLNYSDEQIEQQKIKYSIRPDYYYYYMGLSYYDKKKYDNSIKYYNKAYSAADELKKDIHKLHNSTGITYDEMRNNDKALEYYNKCIGANPKYHSAYYNMAIVYKRMGETDKAIEWYRKAIEINPRYSYAYNNLGNIYKNMNNYEEAIKCYKKAIEYLSTYTLALANIGVCYLKLGNYRDAFNSMARAKEILSTDNNNLSESNKSFLKDTLDQFDREGEIWRQNGFVTTELQSHLQNYDAAFKNLYSQTEKEPVNPQKIMKKEVLQILKLLHQHQFHVAPLKQITALVKTIFGDNEEYFHIIPQVIVRNYYQEAMRKGKPVQEVEKTVLQSLTEISKNVTEIEPQGDAFYQERNIDSALFKHFNPEKPPLPINLLQEYHGIKDYTELYEVLMKVNGQAKDTYKQFKTIVDQTRKQSHGIPYGVQIKIPTAEEVQFPVLLPIVASLLPTEQSRTTTNNVIQQIHQKLKAKSEDKEPLELKDIENMARKAFAFQISAFLEGRAKEKKDVGCDLGDLLKGKILFECADHLRKALSVVDQICYNRGHQILRMTNKLCDLEQEVILNIRVKEIVCQLRLSLKQDETQMKFIQSLEDLRSSPLGCIFGSCLMLCKEINYPLLRNCQDIVNDLISNEHDEKDTLEAALYVVESLNESQLACK